MCWNSVAVSGPSRQIFGYDFHPFKFRPYLFTLFARPSQRSAGVIRTLWSLSL